MAHFWFIIIANIIRIQHEWEFDMQSTGGICSKCTWSDAKGRKRDCWLELLLYELVKCKSTEGMFSMRGAWQAHACESGGNLSDSWCWGKWLIWGMAVRPLPIGKTQVVYGQCLHRLSRVKKGSRKWGRKGIGHDSTLYLGHVGVRVHRADQSCVVTNWYLGIWLPAMRTKWGKAKGGDAGWLVFLG